MGTSAILALLFAAEASAAAREIPPPADALTVEVQTADAERFARAFTEARGKPAESSLRRDYLDRGSYGVEVFTPNRIVDARNLASAVARKPQHYADAIERCLPMAKASTSDLRAIYLALRGVFPEARLPQIYFVVGAGNSGGTAAAGAQVLGLEVLCQISPTPEAFRKTLRQFYAHETVHALQEDAGFRPSGDALLRNVLAEGAADFVARLVTGEEPDPARAAWAMPRERKLWQQFLEDVDVIRAASSDGELTPSQNAATHRWVANYGNAPDGWPSELGYWIGLRIWERYFAAAADKRAALQVMLSISDPRSILQAGTLAFERD